MCCGDTITHLENKSAIETLINDCANVLNKKGQIVLSFRDYSAELNDQQRFIPVKSDNHNILTCILEYDANSVKVTDLLQQKIDNEWNQKS